jgi:hypothetical protein
MHPVVTWTQVMLSAVNGSFEKLTRFVLLKTLSDIVDKKTTPTMIVTAVIIKIPIPFSKVIHFLVDFIK